MTDLRSFGPVGVRWYWPQPPGQTVSHRASRCTIAPPPPKKSHDVLWGRSFARLTADVFSSKGGAQGLFTTLLRVTCGHVIGIAPFPSRFQGSHNRQPKLSAVLKATALLCPIRHVISPGSRP